MERHNLFTQLRQAFRIALDNLRLHENRPHGEGLTAGERLRIMVSVVLQINRYTITGRNEYVNTLNSEWAQENRAIWASELEYAPEERNNGNRRRDELPRPSATVDGDSNDHGDYRRRLVVCIEVSTRFSVAFLTILNINSGNGSTRPISFSSLRSDNGEDSDFIILSNIRTMIK